MASGFIILYTLKFEPSRISRLVRGRGAELIQLKHSLKLTKAFEIIDQGGFICRSRSIHSPVADAGTVEPLPIGFLTLPPLLLLLQRRHPQLINSRGTPPPVPRQ
jgi:hypothetical protein